MSAQVGERHVIPEWSLGDRLRKIRRTAGLSQVEFAEQLGENTKTYAAWELDTSAPRNVVALAKRIEIATGVPAMWVLGVDAGTLVTERDTRQYPAGTSTTARHLSLVTASAPAYLAVPAENGSSVSGSGYKASDDVPRWAVAVNDADSA